MSYSFRLSAPLWRSVAPTLLLLLLVIVRPAIAQSAPEPFRDGDRWAVLGDSITHNGTYHQWIALYYVTRFPDRALEVFNCGISGDTASGGFRRLGWDLLPRQPSVVSVMFGMNDVGRPLYSEPEPAPEVLQQRLARLESYRTMQRGLVGRLQESGARVILVTPSIFDQTAELERSKQTGVNDALAECAAFLRALASETGAALVDFHGPMDRLNRERQAGDPKFTLVGPDRVHPGDAGHLVMAYLFLKAQNVPSEVARLTIDLGTNQFVATNSRVENVRRAGSDLTFTWTANALPFPVDVEALKALDWVPFTNELNREILQVAGLRAGYWQLIIDGEPVRAYSAEQLAAGVNLAEQPATPQYEQALAVLRLMQARTKLVAENLRSLAQIEHQSAPDIEHPVTLEQMQPYLERRLASFAQNPPAASTRRAVDLYPERKRREAESVAAAERLWLQIRAAARPQPHLYALRPLR